MPKESIANRIFKRSFVTEEKLVAVVVVVVVVVASLSLEEFVE